MGSRVCVSVIGEGFNPPQIDMLINAAGGIPNADVSNLAGAVTATQEVPNFGVTAGGEYCGDEVCFPDVTNLSQVCGIVVHECEEPGQPLGKIISWKPNPMGLSCPDGQVCFCFNCWEAQTPCLIDNPEPVDIDWCCDDPCVLFCMLKTARIKAALGDFQVTFRNIDKTITRGRPDPRALKELEDEYRCDCENQQCAPVQSRVMQWRPGC